MHAPVCASTSHLNEFSHVRSKEQNREVIRFFVKKVKGLTGDTMQLSSTGVSRGPLEARPSLYRCSLKYAQTFPNRGFYSSGRFTASMFFLYIYTHTHAHTYIKTIARISVLLGCFHSMSAFLRLRAGSWRPMLEKLEFWDLVELPSPDDERRRRRWRFDFFGTACGRYSRTLAE